MVAKSASYLLDQPVDFALQISLREQPVNTPKSERKKMSMVPSFFGRRSNTPDEIWDPFQGWPFNSDFSPFSGQLRTTFPSSSSETASFAHASIDWKETPNAHVFKADVPGLRKEEVKVEVEDDRILQISGERKREIEDKGHTWHKVERSSGKFMRRFRLPENAKVEQVKASMENGVLTVTVPKAEIRKPDVKSIEISG
ncbi:18.1 kDa class I heat shock protein-like [Coffea eugenioides]|uniref:18.1 kDa class I heat shock protein-like n=1 Tax=Coffea arabica TaxID=13443 RepID=A0ABM4WRZ8_COFAR|nr:18.1 kDa class I heat shock protein-like [Coffea eugenioides]